MELTLTWADFKAFVDDRGAKIQYIEFDTRYFVYTVYNKLTSRVTLPKESTPGADQADFETNYKSTANAEIVEPVSEANGFAIEKIDNNSNGVTYTGSTMTEDALTSDAVWKLKRSTTNGKITTSEFANGGKFNQVYDDRVTIFGDTTFLSDRSVLLDGVNDYLDAGDAFKFDNAMAWSLSFWIKPNNLAAQRVLYSKSSIDANVWGIVLYHTSTGYPYLQMRASGQLRAHTFGIQLVAGVWQHLVMTYSGGQNINGISLYVDDVKDTVPVSAAVTSTLLSGQSAFFGQRSNGFYYSGVFDEISFWNKELSAAEVTTLYNAGEPDNVQNVSFASDLLHYYRCGDGDTFPDIFDNEGTSHLTMINMAADDFVEDVAP